MSIKSLPVHRVDDSSRIFGNRPAARLGNCFVECLGRSLVGDELAARHFVISRRSSSIADHDALVLVPRNVNGAS